MDYQAPQTSRDRTSSEFFGVRNDKKHLSIPVNDQELVQKFESFQEFITKEGNLLNQISREDFQYLEQIYKTLTRDAITEHNYKQEVEKATKELQRIMASKLPASIKAKMMESLGDTIRTNINCIQELKNIAKGMIITLEKTNNYSTYLNLIKQWKETNKASKNLSSASTSTKMNSIAISNVENKHSMIEATPKDSHSFFSVRSTIDDIPEEQKAFDEVKQENAKLEDVIASLKQTRNYLIITVENARDDLEEYEAFVQAKRNLLHLKLHQIENIKIKISEESARSAAQGKLWHTHRQTTVCDNVPTEKSMSRVNTTVLQEVSSKVTNLFGKVFGKKTKEAHSNQVLTTDFLDELNLPSRMETPKANFISAAGTPLTTPKNFSIQMPKFSGRAIMKRLTKH